MSRSVARELSKDEQMQILITEAMSNGWIAELTPNNHIKFTHPLVDRPVFGPKSPSEYRSTKNVASQLKSALRIALKDRPHLGDEAFKRIQSGDKDFARIVDDVLDPFGEGDAMFQCPACYGSGKKKSLKTAEALAAHMGKDHPAPPLPEAKPAPEPELERRAPKPEKSMDDSPQKYPDLDQFEYFLTFNANTEVSIDEALRFFDLPDEPKSRKVIANRAMSVKKRQERHPDRLKGTIEAVRPGVYTFTTNRVDDVEFPEMDAHRNDTNKEQGAMSPEPTKHGRTVKEAGTRLYEWIADTSDGRTIVKDDQGKVWFATFVEL